MTKVQLCFSTSWGPVSTFLRFFTWSQISHVDFVVPEGLLGAREMGVKIRPFGSIKVTRDIIAYVVCTEDQAEQVLGFARAQIGKPYNWLGLLGFAVRRDFPSKKRWFCSELVIAAFEMAGIRLLNIKDVDRVTPEMLLNSPLVVVQQGVEQ
jgi:uncharacterized protein YycO